MFAEGFTRERDCAFSARGGMGGSYSMLDIYIIRNKGQG